MFFSSDGERDRDCDDQLECGDDDDVERDKEYDRERERPSLSSLKHLDGELVRLVSSRGEDI